jgi:hypothetical protein
MRMSTQRLLVQAKMRQVHVFAVIAVGRCPCLVTPAAKQPQS